MGGHQHKHCRRRGTNQIYGFECVAFLRTLLSRSRALILTADRVEPVTPIAQTTVKPNVLIVDDDSIVHLLYGRYLAQVGYEVLTAKNRQEAIAIVSRETVQLIVMDIMMPGGDGLTVLREL